MAAVKKIPMRQCVGCGERKSKKELIRIVCSPSEDPERVTIGFDLTGKKNGRGAYICSSMACLELARKKKALERALKTEVSQQFYDDLKKELEQIER